MHFDIWWSPAKSVVYRLTHQFEEPGWFEFWKTQAFCLGERGKFVRAKFRFGIKTPARSKRSVFENVENLGVGSQCNRRK